MLFVHATVAFFLDIEAWLQHFIELVVIVIVGGEVRVEVKCLVDEQVGLRWVATLVVCKALLEEVFVVVGEEVVWFVYVEDMTILRYGSEGMVTVVLVL